MTLTIRDFYLKELAKGKCSLCMFGKRTRIDNNYRYPIQYICRLTSLRVYTGCYDDTSPEWCPLRTKLLEISAYREEENAVKQEEW